MTEIVNIQSDSIVLHGVVHLPPQQPGPRVGVLISPNGVKPKTGPHRLFHQIAEAMAQAGIYVLRYENRGTCDSPGSCSVTFADRVADAQVALDFFRTRYRLDAVIGWGLCSGATVTLHCAAFAHPGMGFDGLILCGILANPMDASAVEFGIEKVDLPDIARQMFFDGTLIRKLWQAPRKWHIYRQNLPRLAGRLLKRYKTHSPEFERFRAAVGRTGEFLACHPRPCLMLFGEKDIYLKRFVEQVNPGDRLGLAKKQVPPDWALVKDGDHVFASREQTDEAIRHTLEWLDRFRQRYLSNLTQPSPREAHGIPSPSIAN